MLRIHREERAKYEIASPSTTSAPLSINTLRAKAFLAMTILNRFLGRLEMTRGMVLEMTRGDGARNDGGELCAMARSFPSIYSG